MFVVATSIAAPERIEVEAKGLPGQLANQVEYSVKNGKRVPPGALWYSEPVSDDHNIFSLLFADANLIERKYLAGFLPPAVLVN